MDEQWYRKVLVFCTGPKSRNKLGGWETRHIESHRETRDFRFYTAKDVAMSDEADCGFMLWEGKSIGPLHNILNLADRGKQVVLYFASEKDFITVRSLKDVERMLGKCALEDIQRFDKRLDLSRRTRQDQSELPHAT